MDLIDDFDTSYWQKEEDPSKYDFRVYTLLQKPKMLGTGQYQYAAKELTDDGDIPHLMITLDGARGKTNPLKAVRNCELVVNNEKICGVNIDGDCVILKSFANEKIENRS